MLHDKYLFPKAEADAIASFLTPMLRLHPDKRAKASDLIHHNWLEDVVVQGEVDVIRRAEEEESAKKDEAGRWSKAQKRLSTMSQSEVDAMKPVDDIAALGMGDMEQSSKMQPPQAPKLSAAPAASNPRQSSTTITPTPTPTPPRAARPVSSTGPSSSSRRR